MLQTHSSWRPMLLVLLILALAALPGGQPKKEAGALTVALEPRRLALGGQENVTLISGPDADAVRRTPVPSLESAAATPERATLHADDFESGTLDLWRQVSPEDLTPLSGAGYAGTTGLSVTLGTHERYVYHDDLAGAEEGYLTFWFNPSGVSIPDQGTSWIPGKSMRIATVKGTEQWRALVSLWVRRPSGQGYKAYLGWRAEEDTRYDHESGEFDLADGWQKITLGYRVDEWVAVWLNGVKVRQIMDVTHYEARGEIVEIGKTNENSSITPTGALRYDNVAFQTPRVDDLWVDAFTGDDGDDGLTPTTAFRTIQKAAEQAGPGTKVHIMPGVYRETVRPVTSGSAAEPALYLAEYGPGTAIIRGSEPASSLTWTQLAVNTIGLPPGVDPTDLYYADLSAWELDGPPRFVVELDDGGDVAARLPLAREPDWQVSTEWKQHEFWWFANGGSAVAGCDPATDPDPHCDYPWRSYTQLTDTNDDADPAGIEPGNLTTLDSLTGATLVVMDAQHAHYVYRRTIVAHDVAAGRISVDEDCDNDGRPGLGWGSKYYLENHPALLDEPGEWWFDVNSSNLFLWPPIGENPATLNLEISRLDNGFDLENRSYVSLDSLTVELFNGDAYRIYNENPWYKAHGNTLSNVTLRYAERGVLLYQYVSGEAPQLYAVDGFLLEGSEIAYMDTVGIYAGFWWPGAPAPDQFSHSGVRNSVFRNNELHHLGYNSEERSAVGVQVFFPDTLRFESNHVHHVAQNGAHFHLSLVDSTKEYDFSPQEIKLGEILVRDNIFERACQLASDCGALKFGGGSRPYSHVFRDVLVTGNVFRDTFGWSYVSVKRGINAIGDGNGFYLDHASGIHAYRNIAYNNTGVGFKLTCLWLDGDIVYYNNIAANNYSKGFMFTGSGSSCDDHQGSVNTQLVNNVLVNNDAHGIQFVSAYDNDAYGNLIIDHNLYHNNGWNDQAAWNPADIQLYEGSRPTRYFHGLAEIQAGTPWEDHGVGGDPAFVNYDLADHDRYDGSWPDFHITAASVNAVDRGTADLPASLTRLLTAFGIDDVRFGSALDIGRYEAARVVYLPLVVKQRP